MIKSGLIARVLEQHPGLHPAEVEAAVNTILARISDALAADDRVELRGLGVFSCVSRAPRPGRNLSSGETVQVGERRIVSFRASQTIRAELCRPGASAPYRRTAPMVRLILGPRRAPEPATAAALARP